MECGLSADSGRCVRAFARRGTAAAEPSRRAVDAVEARADRRRVSAISRLMGATAATARHGCARQRQLLRFATDPLRPPAREAARVTRPLASLCRSPLRMRKIVGPGDLAQARRPCGGGRLASPVATGLEMRPRVASERQGGRRRPWPRKGPYLTVPPGGVVARVHAAHGASRPGGPWGFVIGRRRCKVAVELERRVAQRLVEDGGGCHMPAYQG